MTNKKKAVNHAIDAIKSNPDFKWVLKKDLEGITFEESRAFLHPDISWKAIVFHKTSKKTIITQQTLEGKFFVKYMEG